MFSRSIEAEAEIDAGGKTKGKAGGVSNWNRHPIPYLPPRQTQTGTVPFVHFQRPGLPPHFQAQMKHPQTPSPQSPGHRTHQAAGFPSKLQLCSSGLNMAGKMVREALADTMGRPLPRVDVGSKN